MHTPVLERTTRQALAWHTDPVLLDRHGILVAFTERTGGESLPPYASLDLAGHVGDIADSVDANRTRLLEALDLGRARDRLTCAEQVHGERIAEVTEAEAGAGAWVSRAATAAVPSADALLTALGDTPLLLCFADCVPVVLVAPGPVRAVAVVHAGWRGALARLPGKAASSLALRAGCDTSSLLAYVGAHVCADCYPVGQDVLSLFAEAFASIGAPQGRLDLGAVVSGSLREAGVPDERQVRLGICTAESTDRFFSYRAEGVTGRHGAVAVVLQGRG